MRKSLLISVPFSTSDNMVTLYNFNIGEIELSGALKLSYIAVITRAEYTILSIPCYLRYSVVEL